MRRVGRVLGAVLCLLVVLLILAACDRSASTPQVRGGERPAEVVVQATATETPASGGGAGALPTKPVLPPAPSATPSTGPAVLPPPGSGLLPDLLAKVRLAPAGAQLDDLLLDVPSNRLYVTDTAGQLHVLDAVTYDPIATLPASGTLTLDPDRGRLYASPLYGEGDVAVVDTTALSVVGTIAPGGFVSLDSRRNRVYVGNPVYGLVEEGTPGVRVYDATTLEQVGEVPQPGIPVYNPLRDELYIVAYTLYLADPEALQVTGDLMPEITSQPLAWCNGCLAVTGAQLDPDRNLLVVEVTALSPGKGPGMMPPPRFFDATTLQEILDPAALPPVERGCGGRMILAEPVDRRVYRDEQYSRYVFYNNLLVYDLEGVLETWRDGLYLGITNPNTGQMYVPHGADTLVMDLAALSPVGSLPPVCVANLDAGAGRLYGLLDRDLLVFSEKGGTAAVMPAGRPGPLPREQILTIQPSPGYARDSTIFLTAPGKVYRSIDAGQTWAQLHGGLPEGEYLTLDLAISPAFTQDRTLFAGGFRDDFWGEGVYRSTDGGESWQPVWNDLLHLRVYDLALSPEYARDGTVWAYSRYQRLTPWQSGLSLFRSADAGLSWTMVMTWPQESATPPPAAGWPGVVAQPAVHFRAAADGQGVERSTDGGQTWEPVVVTHEPGFYVQDIVTSPSLETDGTVYVVSEYDLFRSTDFGDTWARWVDGRLAGRDYTNKLATAAASPPLSGGGHRLFVGTAAGEFWPLDPATLAWEPVPVVEPWPTVLDGEWVSAIQPSQGGSVWLGTWGEGVAHYAEGTIQARYTITDGLPSQYIRALAATPDGTVWAGGDWAPGASSFDGRAWTSHPFDAEGSFVTVLDLEVGPDGVLWVGSDPMGLLRWTGKAWEVIPDPEGVTGWRVNDIEVAADGTVWCATAQGLIFYQRGAWYGQGGGDTAAVEFGPAQEQTAYLLTSGAVVWRYGGGQWTQLPSPQESQYLSARVLYVAADGAVWLGTSSGAFRYDGRAWRQFTAENGLPANEVTAMAEDGLGWLWFGTEDGAARVDSRTLGLSAVSWPALPTPTPTPRAAPAAARPAPTKAAVLPTSTPCHLRPADLVAGAYRQGETARRLGCPVAEPAVTRAAFQPFERGLMLWRADERAIYVLDAGGAWARYSDTWDESQPPDDPDLKPPADLHQPVRGFGKVWREQLGGAQAAIGWAVAGEQAYDMVVQPFERGLILSGPDGSLYTLYMGGTWEIH